MVHDEEAEISIRLATLIANTQRSRSAAGSMPLEVPSTTLNDAVAGSSAATQTEAPKGISSSLLMICLELLQAMLMSLLSMALSTGAACNCNGQHDVLEDQLMVNIMYWSSSLSLFSLPLLTLFITITDYVIHLISM